MQMKHICDYVALFIAVFAISLYSPNLSADKSQSTTININNDWQYWENHSIDFAEAQNNKAWESIQLPHTWNAKDTVDTVPGYRRSASWYKRELAQSELNANGRTLLYFEGANFETEVYVNSTMVGEHTGGYIGFSFDITPFLKAHSKNELFVRVSNRFNRNLIPSQKSDFFLYGGITRDVWIQHVPETFIDKVHVLTPTVSNDAADTKLQLRVESTTKQSAQMTFSLYSPQGEMLAEFTSTKSLNKGSNQIEVDLPTLNKPNLWSPDSPSLYSIQVTLNTKKDNHTVTERFGYRWFEMRPHQGFFLNGERLLIRGTHRHEEHAGLGAALSNEQHRKDMEMIKNLGANFVRLGHYPQDPEVYRAADELGLLIWDEIPWCRGGKGGLEWEKNTEHYLNTMIQQNRNHPSIVFWSLGNEIYWEEDFEGGGATELLNPYLEKLNNIAKKLDPSRLTSIRKYYPGAEIVDAFSPSIWAGWYGGSYSQYEAALKKAHAKYPAFLHIEYGGSSHVGRHTEYPITAEGLVDAQVSVEEAVNQAVVRSVAKGSDWNENYIVDLFDWHLSVSESLEGFAGNAQWAFKDFGTPLRPENPLPNMNIKGLVDREGNPKDAYYVFASYWSPTPMCWIESHTWTHRNGPKEGRDVTVYCNTERAELFLNGQSLGIKVKQHGVVPAGGLVWKVPFKEGVNALEVHGYNQDKLTATDALNVTYHIGKHGKFKRIKLTAQKTEDNLILIEAEALDKQGHRVLSYAERAYFFNIGDEGELLENYGTPNKSSVIEMASGYAAVLFKPGAAPSTIEFRTQNIKGVYIDVPAR